MIVADSSALIALSTCQSLWLLERLFDDLKIPPAVFKEVTVLGKRHAQTLRTYLTDKMVPIDSKSCQIKGNRGLGAGEFEAMILYLQLSADLLLIDDAKARKVASLNQIDIIGSLGILLRAKQEKLLTNLKPHLKILKASELYISEHLIEKTLNLAGE